MGFFNCKIKLDVCMYKF
uniref:Uncharacterized protein n=1 Tax=Lepeophtheirus salmonis TaxID=72036 RepID=A0A0K2TPR8_LEPSM